MPLVGHRRFTLTLASVGLALHVLEVVERVNLIAYLARWSRSNARKLVETKPRTVILREPHKSILDDNKAWTL